MCAYIVYQNVTRIKTMTSKTVTRIYLMGIADARAVFRAEGMESARAHLDNLNSTIKLFDASSPVGQLLRGERDFWRNQIKAA
jgi:hypothetical protein